MAWCGPLFTFSLCSCCRDAYCGSKCVFSQLPAPNNGRIVRTAGNGCRCLCALVCVSVGRVAQQTQTHRDPANIVQLRTASNCTRSRRSRRNAGRTWKGARARTRPMLSSRPDTTETKVHTLIYYVFLWKFREMRNATMARAQTQQQKQKKNNKPTEESVCICPCVMVSCVIFYYLIFPSSCCGVISLLFALVLCARNVSDAL